MRSAPLIAALVLVAAPAAAIPAVGERAPAVAGTDISGKARTLKQLAGKKGTVLMFFRSAEWCPYCKAQLIAMNAEAAAPLAARGYTLVGLSYDAVPVLAKFAAERNVGWPLLSDPQSKVIDGWQLRDPAYPPGNRANGVPRPAIYVIDAKGVIRARLMEENYRNRPPASAVLAAVDALGQ
ncbi:peroxiredoxin family protein [Sandarakinorhabdus rubra]|uniref:peroxiredoxin family protein n=1 Tax=Sandarakinorhabdus rubra TaxID=2672568 RepID=UPI0013D98F63|nr:peroxiredoxin family protein [Sandarakinorhabdus rubra]